MHGPSGARRLAGGSLAAAWLAAAWLVAGCGVLASPAPTAPALPTPTCGGAMILIPGALPCNELVGIALRALRAEVPVQFDRGVIAVTVDLGGCPRNEVPAQLDCIGEDFVQLVTFTFGPSVPGGPTEPSMSVGVAPVSGRVLGIVNPLLR